MNSPKIWKSLLKWGLVLCAGLAVLEIVKMVARNVGYVNTSVFDIAMIIGYILILHMGVKEFKELYPHRLSFAKAYMACIVISFVGSVLFFGYEMFHYQIIEKDGLQKKYDTALQNFKKVIYNDTVQADELTRYSDTVSAFLKAQQTIVLADKSIADSTRQEVLKGVSLIDQYFEDKLCAQRKLDTSDNYRMGNFAQYARRVLLETLTLYEGQNEQRASTQYVAQIVSKANDQLANVNPALERFEQNKSHVPHYEQPGRYAGVASAMDLLYGLFFGLFVALFNYKSKNAVEQAQDNFKVPESGQATEQETN